jgi:hypothetical protein
MPVLSSFQHHQANCFRTSVSRKFPVFLCAITQELHALGAHLALAGRKGATDAFSGMGGLPLQTAAAKKAPLGSRALFKS